MNEINELYELVLGKPKSSCYSCKELIECEILKNTHNCNHYVFNAEKYFTPEVQLNLIKWLSTSQGVFIKENTVFTGFESGKTEDLICCQNDDADFEKCLAGLISYLW